jgi:hypothetical protein
MNRARELVMLRLADRLIAGGEAALMKQIADIDKLHADGYDTTLAERNLRAFADGVNALKDRRGLIVMTIRQIDHGLI